MDREAWYAAVHGVAKSWTRLSDWTELNWCKEPIRWKRSWCWERLKVGGEGDDRGWDGWMASQTQWTWVWVNSGSWWWTGRPGMLQSMGSQRVRYDWATELNVFKKQFCKNSKAWKVNWGCHPYADHPSCPHHPNCGSAGGIKAFTEHSLETSPPERLKSFSTTIRDSKFLGFSRDKWGPAGRKLRSKFLLLGLR